MKLLDVILVVILLCLGIPMAGYAIATLSGIILPLGFICIILWWMFGPREEK